MEYSVFGSPLLNQNMSSFFKHESSALNCTCSFFYDFYYLSKKNTKKAITFIIELEIK